MEGHTQDVIDVSMTQGMPSGTKKVPNHLRTTPRYLTKFERARVLGARALQISMGAPAMIDTESVEREKVKALDPLFLAEQELKQCKSPIIIRRHLPDGTFEDWTVEELLLEK
eukprot:gnl/Dysnectes_brevis/380_a422_7995.p1 GENE.gnl/Dysnectes_brevis/380_a422_7995~~gnl/Dysnectes_brevis/380_a422_7995.p1  ORF type:complete len:113 (-),score=9.55 gnl/Dysnectes_brevis/380_a422_7995:67-405(-)